MDGKDQLLSKVKEIFKKLSEFDNMEYGKLFEQYLARYFYHQQDQLNFGSLKARFCQAMNKEEFAHFLQAKDTGKIVFPPNSAGPDICFFLVQAGTTRLVSIQAKHYRSCGLSSSKATHAWETVVPQYFFTQTQQDGTVGSAWKMLTK